MKEGEIVQGITDAVNTLKRKQNALAIPEFRSQNDFVLETNRKTRNSKFIPDSKDINLNESDDENKFKSLLNNLSKQYPKFPVYMIDIMAKDAGIPPLEIPLLIDKFAKKGFLIRLKAEDLYFKVSPEI
jgi:hypothetical protein